MRHAVPFSLGPSRRGLVDILEAIKAEVIEAEVGSLTPRIVDIKKPERDAAAAS